MLAGFAGFTWRITVTGEGEHPHQVKPSLTDGVGDLQHLFGRLIDHADARIAALSEHHATVVWPDDAPLPPVGTRLRVIPNHVCLTTNLVDDVAVVRDATLIDRWKVAARGKNH